MVTLTEAVQRLQILHDLCSLEAESRLHQQEEDQAKWDFFQKHEFEIRKLFNTLDKLFKLCDMSMVPHGSHGSIEKLNLDMTHLEEGDRLERLNRAEVIAAFHRIWTLCKEAKEKVDTYERLVKAEPVSKKQTPTMLAKMQKRQGHVQTLAAFRVTLDEYERRYEGRRRGGPSASGAAGGANNGADGAGVNAGSLVPSSSRQTGGGRTLGGLRETAASAGLTRPRGDGDDPQQAPAEPVLDDEYVEDLGDQLKSLDDEEQKQGQILSQIVKEVQDIGQIGIKIGETLDAQMEKLEKIEIKIIAGTKKVESLNKRLKNQVERVMAGDKCMMNVILILGLLAIGGFIVKAVL